MSACARMSNWLPQAKPRFEDLYVERVADLMNSKTDQTIVDVGGGKSCRFAHRRDPGLRNRIVCVDIAEEEMRCNTDVDEKRVADIMQSLPFDDASVDLIVSRSVLEHLQDQERFVKGSYRALKPGGHCVHFFPSKYAPFAIINRLLPDAISRRLVQRVFEGKEGILGFPAVYNRTYHSAFTRLLRENGFSIERVDVCYFQSGYFSFFVPFFLLSAVYEWCVRALRLKNLCAYLIVVARKENLSEDGSGEPAPPEALREGEETVTASRRE